MVLDNEFPEIAEKVFEAIMYDNFEDVKRIYDLYDLGTDVLDEYGMTPLQHAAYKGNEQAVRWFLDRGANVNSKNNYSYSTLHFAALSGNPVVCRLLLDAGANRQSTNCVGRTASQLVAFMGNRHCVAVINNYIPEKEVACYTIPENINSEPKLHTALVQPVHKFIMMTNIHPVKVALEIPPVFLADDNASKIYKVLNLMCELEIKKQLETNEVMAFKFHYLACILIEVTKYNDPKSKNESDPKKLFINKILKNEYYLEQFLFKDCIVMFPFTDCTIFKQMIASMTRGKDSMSALNVILLMIGNRYGMSVDSIDDEHICDTCIKNNPTKKCAKCEAVQYCNRECQRIHWFNHKKKNVTIKPFKINKM